MCVMTVDFIFSVSLLLRIFKGLSYILLFLRRPAPLSISIARIPRAVVLDPTFFSLYLTISILSRNFILKRTISQQ